MSRSVKLLVMNAAAELSMFLVIDPLMVSDLLEWYWHHSENINHDWFLMMIQSTKSDSRLSGEHGTACAMRYSVISIVTSS